MQRQLTDNDRCLTVGEFCILESIDPDEFWRLREDDICPAVIAIEIISGLWMERITPSARLEWHRKLAARLEVMSM